MHGNLCTVAFIVVVKVNGRRGVLKISDLRKGKRQVPEPQGIERTCIAHIFAGLDCPKRPAEWLIPGEQVRTRHNGCNGETMSLENRMGQGMSRSGIGEARPGINIADGDRGIVAGQGNAADVV